MEFEDGFRLIDGNALNAAIENMIGPTGPTGPSGSNASGITGPTGPTGVDGTAAANVVLQDQDTGALVLSVALPTTDPAVANALWNSDGVLRISAG